MANSDFKAHRWAGLKIFAAFVITATIILGISTAIVFSGGTTAIPFLATLPLVKSLFATAGLLAAFGSFLGACTLLVRNLCRGCCGQREERRDRSDYDANTRAYRHECHAVILPRKNDYYKLLTGYNAVVSNEFKIHTPSPDQPLTVSDNSQTPALTNKKLF